MSVVSSLGKFRGWSFPIDRHSPQAWNRWWQDIIALAPRPTEMAEGTWAPPGPHCGYRDDRWFSRVRGYESDPVYHNIAPVLRARGCRRVLYPGCGLDVLPHFLEHEGFETVAADVSEAALAYQRSNSLGIGWKRFWLCWALREFQFTEPTTTREEVAARFPCARVEGGSLAFRQADAFQKEAEENQWDAVVTRNLVEHFEDAERHTLLTNMHRWLRPGGHLILQTETRPRLGTDPAMFRPFGEVEEAGFVIPRRRVEEWNAAYRGGDTSERDAIIAEAEAEEVRAIERGEKVAIICTV